MVIENQNGKRFQRWRRWGTVVAFSLIIILYLVTLQRIVNGSGHDYAVDTGEIQVALNTVGTIHYTGYPLYTMLSTVVTLSLRTIGIAPAAAASLSSLLWSLLALAIGYRLLLHLTDGAAVLSASALLLLAVTETVWMHSVIAEVYSFSLLLTALFLLLVVRLTQKPERVTWLLLMLVWGAAVAHHRSLLLLFPALLFAAPVLLPLLYRRPSWLLYGLLAFIIPFMAYLYLPSRAWQGAEWVYGEPGTWQGFWRQFTGSEVTGRLLRLPTRDKLVPNAVFLMEHLRRQLPWPLLIGGLAGLLWYARSRPWWASGLLGIVLALTAFVFLFPGAVWAPAVLLPVVLVLTAGLVLLAQALARGTYAQTLLALLFVAGAVWLLWHNGPFVHKLVTNPTGEEVVDTLEWLEPVSLEAEEPVVAIPWGTSYFAAVFGQQVEGRLPGLILVDHRVDFRQVIANNRRLLTPTFTSGFWPLDWWQSRLGPVTLDEVAPGVIEIGSQNQLPEDLPAGAPFDTEVGFALWAKVEPVGEATLRLTLWWQLVEPVAPNYSVAVHVVSQDPPLVQDHLLVSADVLHPLDGWYPTSRWQPREVVRDAYLIPFSRNVAGDAVALRMALYRHNESGQFINSRWLSLPLNRQRR